MRGGRGANGLWPDRRTFLELPVAQRHARHRYNGQGHWQRIPNGRRRDYGRDREVSGIRVPFQHVRGQPDVVRRRPFGIKGTRRIFV